MTLEERKAIYTALCEKGRITALFMQPWWLDACGSWDVALAVRNEQVVGALPFSKSRRWGVPVIGMPAMTHHLQIWMDKPPDISPHKWLTREKQIIWLLIDALPPYGYFSMVFEENSFNNWLPFHWKGFRQEMRYTFIIDPMDPSTTDQNINRNLKRNLKDAGTNLEIKRGVESETFFNLCRHTYQRQKMGMPYTLEAFTKIDMAVRQHECGITLGAYDPNQRLIGVSYLLWDADRAYYFLAGDNEEGKLAGAGILLCREALRIAFEEKKVKSFDFCGSMLEPITEIRRQFGARAVGLMKIFKSKYKVLDVVYALTR